MKRFLIFGFSLFLLACHKYDIPPSSGSYNLELSHEVDGTPLSFEQFLYTNAAGNNYQVTSLRYYLSGFRLYHEDGSVYSSDGIFYVDASDKSTHRINLDSIPFGRYTGLRFYIGLAPGQNISNSLPNEHVHNNMFWPDQMGGGYHFMKFEGRFMDSTGAQKGYAIHTGTNIALTEVDLQHEFSVERKNHYLFLSMNLNEWFENPHLFDLEQGINYTMGDTTLMMMVAENGADVFGVE